MMQPACHDMTLTETQRDTVSALGLLTGEIRDS
jgi:hypothetical protein